MNSDPWFRKFPQSKYKAQYAKKMKNENSLVELPGVEFMMEKIDQHSKSIVAYGQIVVLLVSFEAKLIIL